MPEILTIEPITMDPSEIEKVESFDLLKTEAEDLLIEDGLTYERAGENIESISIRIRDLDELRKKLKAPILEAGRNVDNIFKEPINRGKAAKRTIQTKMLAYRAECVEANQRAATIANEDASREKTEIEQEALEKMDAGDFDGAQTLLDTVDTAPPPVLINDLPKTEGLSLRANWKWRLIDLKKLVQAIGNGQAPIRLIQVNTVAANQFAKSVRDTLPTPGLEFYNDESFARKKR